MYIHYVIGQLRYVTEQRCRNSVMLCNGLGISNKETEWSSRLAVWWNSLFWTTQQDFVHFYRDIYQKKYRNNPLTKDQEQ